MYAYCQARQDSRSESVRPCRPYQALDPDSVKELRPHSQGTVPTEYDDLVATSSQVTGQIVDVCLCSSAPRRLLSQHIWHNHVTRWAASSLLENEHVTDLIVGDLKHIRDNTNHGRVGNQKLHNFWPFQQA
jgi:hypothetical protein